MLEALEIRNQINEILINEEIDDTSKKLVKLYENLTNIYIEKATSKQKYNSWNGNKSKKGMSTEDALKLKITFLKWNEDVNNKTLEEIYKISQKDFNWILNKSKYEKPKKAAELVKAYFEKQSPVIGEGKEKVKTIGATKANEIYLYIKKHFSRDYNNLIQEWLDKFNKKELADITEQQCSVMKVEIDKKVKIKKIYQRT